MCPSRLVVQAAAGGRQTPSDPLSRPPRRAAQLHHSSQPVQLEGSNNIVPAPAHTPLADEPDAQEVQLVSSSGADCCGSTPAAHAVTEHTADRATATSAGPSSASVGPAAGRFSWSDGRTASQLAGLHRPAGLVIGSAWLLAFSLELAGKAVAALRFDVPTLRHAHFASRLPLQHSN